MNWNLLYQQSSKKEKKKIGGDCDQPDENSMISSNGSNENEELYQRKLFENDLYVWSLLLLLPDKKNGLK